MTTFVVSDTHLFHYNIVLHCNRLPWIYDNPNYNPALPYHFKTNNPKAVNLESHDRDMIRNWNSVVSKHDEVWLLGDVAWKRHGYFIQALNGKKFLIRGNHDKMDLTSLKQFSMLSGSHFQYSYYTQIYGRRIMFSHCPYETWFSSPHGSWNLHGHCHGRLPEKDSLLRFDMGVDVWGYYPVPWDVIEAKMVLKEKLKKELFTSDGKSEEDEDEEQQPQYSVSDSKRVEAEAGESYTVFMETKNKNIELMKKFGVINEKTNQAKAPELQNVQTAQDEVSKPVEAKG